MVEKTSPLCIVVASFVPSWILGFVELEYYQDAVRVVNHLYCILGVRRIGDLVHGALRTTNCLIKRVLGDARVKGVPGAVAAIKKVLSDIASDAAHIRSDVRF